MQENVIKTALNNINGLYKIDISGAPAHGVATGV